MLPVYLKEKLNLTLQEGFKLPVRMEIGLSTQVLTCLQKKVRVGDVCVCDLLALSTLPHDGQKTSEEDFPFLKSAVRQGSPVIAELSFRL